MTPATRRLLALAYRTAAKLYRRAWRARRAGRRSTDYDTARLLVALVHVIERTQG